jgi:hypothetical protein
VRRIDAHIIGGWLAAETVAKHQGESVVITCGRTTLGSVAIPPLKALQGKERWLFRIVLDGTPNSSAFDKIGFRIGSGGPAFFDSPAHCRKNTSLRPEFEALASAEVDPGAPLLDQPDVAEETLTERQRRWRRDGVLILPGFLPDDLIEAYKKERWRLLPSLLPWKSPVAYVHVPTCRALCTHRGLSEVLEEIMGEPMAVNLTLTGWLSTERDWHQDCYLNPPFVNDWYAAVWIALEDIAPESGLFEYVPGSHRGLALSREKVLAALNPSERNREDWPVTSERFVVPACEAKIKRSGAEVKQFLAKKGDVLIWHGRLLHRGSKAKVHGTPRRALIAHYSGVMRRPDFPPAVQEEGAGWYFPSKTPLY